MFCCFTGLRISDVQKLIWKEVVTTNNETYINFRQKKTKIENYVPLSENAISVLPSKRENTETDSVFDLPKESTIRKVLKKWVSDSGIVGETTVQPVIRCIRSFMSAGCNLVFSVQ